MISYVLSNFWELAGKAALLAVFLRVFWSFCKGIYTSYIGSMLGLSLNFRKQGKWAVVTGATDGIGRAFAFELARRGLNIVLISRTRSKLEMVSGELRSMHNVETEIIEADFTKIDVYDKIKSSLENLDIGVLINNVGMSYGHPDYYVDLDQSFISNLMICNMHSAAHMTRIVLPGMLERRRGFIMNISSICSLIPTPLLTLYAASKAFMVNFSKNLALEVKSKGVTVQCVSPGYVTTKMSKIRNTSMNVPNPEDYVQATLRTAGLEGSTCGYPTHKFQIYLLEWVQQYTFGYILTKIVLDQFIMMRNKVYARKQQVNGVVNKNK